MSDERRLARPVLADDRHPLAAADAERHAVDRARTARRRGRALRPRSRRGLRHDGRVETRRLQRACQPGARRRLDAQLHEQRVGKDLTGRPVEHDPAAAIATTRVHRPSSRSSCARRSGATCRRPRAGAGPRRRGASRPGPAAPSVRRGSRGAAASPAATRCRRAGPGRRRAAPGREAGSTPSPEQGRPRPLDGLGDLEAQVHRPERDLPRRPSRRSPDRCVFGFWKPTTTRVASSCVGRPAIGSPSIVSVPGQRPADRRRRETRGDQAQASTCRPRSARPVRRSHRRASVRSMSRRTGLA